MDKRVAKALAKAGAVLARGRRHLVYKFPGGGAVTLSKTASDGPRAAENQLRDIRRAAKQKEAQ